MTRSSQNPQLAFQVVTGDVLEWAEAYTGEPFHALLCDPPYHLNSIIKRFAKTGAADRMRTTSGPHQRTARGFMGKEWDGGDIAFRPETWAVLANLLHPGAFLMAFAGTRGYHRMACAIEDAGLIIHPAIGWLFGSGFPKATRIKGDPVWSGHRYGLQAMKPAFEFIAVAQKPYEGKPVENITKTGAGALNIDLGRINSGGMENHRTAGAHQSSGAGLNPYFTRENQQARAAAGENPRYDAGGRWPANLAMDEVGAAVLDRQSGISGGSSMVIGGAPRKTEGHICTGSPDRKNALMNYGDEGGASRYYLNSDWTPELAESDPAFYCAKAGSAERNAGLEGLAPSVSDYRPNDPDENKIQTRLHPMQPRVNPHPTVKPIRLTRWLASMLLPPAAYAPRRILIPFCGSGSEAIGALLAGWDEVIGIEREEEYAEIARARCRFWQGNSGLFESLTATEPESAQEGLAL